jgi:predicted nucleic acid-binding protein
VRAIDTSVAVAAFATWHESHDRALRAVAAGAALPAPCALEVYAVLTRLPPPHRAAPEIVRDFLAATFPGDRLTLTKESAARLIETLVERGVAGGATYDAVIGLIARDAGATLVTLDARALPTYERMGTAAELVA